MGSPWDRHGTWTHYRFAGPAGRPAGFPTPPPHHAPTPTRSLTYTLTHARHITVDFNTPKIISFGKKSLTILNWNLEV